MNERIRDEIVLELSHVTKRFGGLTAVGDVSFKVRKGEILRSSAPTARARPPYSTSSPASMP